jgi:hypothetical protein
LMARDNSRCKNICQLLENSDRRAFEKEKACE